MINRWGHANIWAVALPLASLCHFSTAAHAQGARSVYLYNAAVGSAQASVNDARNAPWGNGEATNDRRMEYEGAPVLRVTTRNLQEGVRFDLKNPVDLDALRETGFLRLRVRFRESMGFGGGFPGMGGPGGPPGMGMPGMGGLGGPPGMVMPPMGGGMGGGRFGMAPKVERTANLQIAPRMPSRGALPQFGGGMMQPGMMQPGMMQPGMMPPGMGMPGMGMEGEFPGGMGGMMPPPQSTQITQFLVTLIRENGAAAGTIPVDLKATTADETGWRLLTLPLKNLTSTPGASGRVTRVVLTSDKEDSFYLAQAALVVESAQMTVSLRRPSDAAGAQIAEITVKPGPVTLVADVEAGATDPIVEWNFDADKVGNLPPGALSNPMGAMGGMGDGMGTPGMGMPGMAMPGGGFPGAAGQGAFGGTPTTSRVVPPGMPGMGGPGMVPGMPGMTPDGMMGMQVGPRLDARGLTATFEYPNEEQNYRVEVTVRDRSGKKEPVTASILVQVRA